MQLFSANYLLLWLLKHNCFFMENKKLPLLDNPLDVKTSKTSTSRFYFLVGFFGYFIFAIAGCYNLYTHHYRDAKEVVVQPSSLYNPQYDKK